MKKVGDGANTLARMAKRYPTLLRALALCAELRASILRTFRAVGDIQFRASGFDGCAKIESILVRACELVRMFNFKRACDPYFRDSIHESVKKRCRCSQVPATMRVSEGIQQATVNSRANID